MISLLPLLSNSNLVEGVVTSLAALIIVSANILYTAVHALFTETVYSSPKPISIVFSNAVPTVS